MKKLIFTALAAVFMLSSGFITESNSENSLKSDKEDFACQCACLTIHISNTGAVSVLRAYVKDQATCASTTNGTGVYNDKDCQNTAGILNNQSSATLQEASKC